MPDQTPVQTPDHPAPPRTPDRHDPAGSADAAQALVHHMAWLLAGVRGAIRRVRLQVADASLELEWQERLADAEAAIETDEQRSDLYYLRAPMIGTFYVAPEPGAEPFVQAGDEVRKGQQVAIIEAMKIMNEVQADRPGRIVEILVANGTRVEFDQPLFALAVADSDS
ncbi:biotin/lipoyl-containing protein [Nonomuraea sp. NPDC052634]|uniref:acetyl-CoA carboxylase biotin carboxyl carrier protein n=1 Tax=Nonomuraea sp. NPDC052634 TaxID=3155813 RepID=UPI00342EA889